MRDLCLNLLQEAHKEENCFSGPIDSEQHTKIPSNVNLYPLVTSNTFGGGSVFYALLRPVNGIRSGHYTSCTHNTVLSQAMKDSER